MPEATTSGDRAEAPRNEITVSVPAESSGQASRGVRLNARLASQSPEARRAARAASKAAEARRQAICAATRMAVGAGAYEVPPAAGSLGCRPVLENLLNETVEGRALVAEAARHTGGCYRRVPDRPISVGCTCRADTGWPNPDPGMGPEPYDPGVLPDPTGEPESGDGIEGDPNNPVYGPVNYATYDPLRRSGGCSREHALRGQAVTLRRYRSPGRVYVKQRGANSHPSLLGHN